MVVGDEDRSFSSSSTQSLFPTAKHARYEGFHHDISRNTKKRPRVYHKAHDLISGAKAMVQDVCCFRISVLFFMTVGTSKCRQQHASFVGDKPVSAHSGSFPVGSNDHSHGPMAELDGCAVIRELESISRLPGKPKYAEQLGKGVSSAYRRRGLSFHDAYTSRQSSIDSRLAVASNASSGSDTSTFRNLSQFGLQRVLRSSELKNNDAERINTFPSSRRKPQKNLSTSSDRSGRFFPENFTTSPVGIGSPLFSENPSLPSPDPDAQILNRSNEPISASSAAGLGLSRIASWVESSPNLNEPDVASPPNPGHLSGRPYLSKLNTNIQKELTMPRPSPVMASSVSALSSTTLPHKSWDSGITAHSWNASPNPLISATAATAISCESSFSANYMNDGLSQCNPDYLPYEQNLYEDLITHEQIPYSMPPIPAPNARIPRIGTSGKQNQSTPSGPFDSYSTQADYSTSVTDSPYLLIDQSPKSRTEVTQDRSQHDNFNHPRGQTNWMSQRPAISSSQDQSNLESAAGEGFPASLNAVAHGPPTAASREGRLKCPDCSKDFACKPNLSRHMNIHKNKVYPCRDKCGKIFTRTDNRNTHEERHRRDQFITPLEEQPRQT